MDTTQIVGHSETHHPVRGTSLTIVRMLGATWLGTPPVADVYYPALRMLRAEIRRLGTFHTIQLP